MPLTGPCQKICHCDGCCPGMSCYDTLVLSFSVAGVGGSVTIYSDRLIQVLQRVSADPDDGTYCGVQNDYACCDSCQCRFNTYDLLAACTDPPAVLTCESFPAVSGGRVIAAELYCDPTAGFSVSLTLTNTTCDAGPIGPCDEFTAVYGVGMDAFTVALNRVTAPLDTETLVCRCPDGFYAKFGPPAGCIADGGLPGPVADSGGYVEVTGTDPGRPCPWEIPCPEITHTYKCWEYRNIVVNGVNIGSGCAVMYMRTGRTDWYGEGEISGFLTRASMTNDAFPVLKVSVTVLGVEYFLGSFTAASVDDDGTAHFNSGGGTTGPITWTIDETRVTNCPCE